MDKQELLKIIEKARVEEWEELDLAGNELTELPPEIGSLVKLKRLILGKWDSKKVELIGNNISFLPKEIGQLTALQQLYLSGNQLTEIPAEIGQLTALQQLYLSGNQLTEMPAVIGQLTALQILNLSRNKLKEIPAEIGQLTSLQILNLGLNELREIPVVIRQLTSLQELNLIRNPLVNPPIEVANQGIQAIRNYFRQIEKGKDTLFEAKLIIVGEGGVGKTTLARRINNPKCPLPEEKESTQGIDIQQWNFVMEGQEKDFRVNIWDFGGQEIYHATHQFFLTKRSVYAVVADNRQESPNLPYWLEIVELLSNKSPVLLIKNEKKDQKVQINEKELRARFENIKESLPTNFAADNRGLTDIINNLKFQLQQLPHVGTTLPKTWINIRNELERLFKEERKNYISLNEYYKICEDMKVTDRTFQLEISQFLHDIGVILHFQDDPISTLYNTVILNPEWGTDAVYKVLDEPTVINQLGRFNNTDLGNIWNEAKYETMQPQLLELMLKFKLCYELPKEKNTYIAPQLLTKEPPEYEFNTTQNLQLKYEYEFLPKAIIIQFIVEMSRLIDESKVWQKGVVLKRESNGQITYAEIVESYNRREINIRLDGEDKREFLGIITNKLEEIHESYNQLQVKALISCNCEVCKDSQKPYLHSLPVLKNFLNKNKTEAQCQKSGILVPIWNLIGETIGEDIYKRITSERERITNQTNNFFNDSPSTESPNPPESPQPTPLHPIERRNLQVGIIVSILTLIVTFCGLVFTNIWNPFKPSNNNNQNQQTQPSLTPSPTPSPSPSQP